MGFSSSVCAQQQTRFSNFTIQCKTGEIEQLVSFGINPGNAINRDTCYENAETQKCNTIIRRDELKQSFMDQCRGKTGCRFNISSYIEKGNEAPELTHCYNARAEFFGQVYCKQTAEQLKEKSSIGTKLTVQTIIIIVLLMVASYYFRVRGSEQYKQWDKDTKTIADYTVKLEIPKRAYDYFLKEEEPKRRKFPQESTNYRFKEYLREEVERILNEDVEPEDSPGKHEEEKKDFQKRSGKESVH